jgi:hypothetical protein
MPVVPFFWWKQQEAETPVTPQILRAYISSIAWTNKNLLYYRINEDNQIVVLGEEQVPIENLVKSSNSGRSSIESLGGVASNKSTDISYINPLSRTLNTNEEWVQPVSTSSIQQVAGSSVIPIRQKMIQRPSNFTLNSKSPLNKGLVFAALGMGRGSLTMRDSSKNRRHGTLMLMDPTTDWVWNKKLNRFVLDFDGLDDYVSITNAPSILTPPFSYSCWLYATASPVNRDLFGENNTAGAFQMRFDGTSLLSAYISGISVTRGTIPIITLNQWYHLVYIRRANAVGSSMFYWDGISASLETDAVNAMSPLGTTWHIGSRLTSSEFWRGKIADTMLWNRALSLGEVQSLSKPSNVDLSIGSTPLILSPRRVFFPSSTAPSSVDRLKIPLEQLVKVQQNEVLDIDWSQVSASIVVVKNLILDLDWGIRVLSNKISSLDYSQKLLGGLSSVLEWRQPSSTSNKLDIENLVNALKTNKISLDNLGGVAPNKILDLDWGGGTLTPISRLLQLDLDFTQKLLGSKNINEDWTIKTLSSLITDIESRLSILGISSKVDIESLLNISGSRKESIDYLSNLGKGLTGNIDFIQKIQSALKLNINWSSNAYIIQNHQLSVEVLSQLLGVANTPSIESLAGIIKTLKLDIDYDGVILVLQVSDKMWILGSRGKTWILGSRGKTWILDKR